MAHRSQDTYLQGAVARRIACKLQTCKEQSHGASLARMSDYSRQDLARSCRIAHRSQDCPIIPYQSCKEQSHGASLARLSDYSIPVLQGEVAWRLARKTVQLYPTSHAGSSHMAHPSHDCPIIPHQSCKEQSQDAWASALSPRFLLGCKL